MGLTMRNLDKRLTRLEKAVMPDGKRFAVVKYDVETGPPAGAPAAGVVYLPHNGRDGIGGLKSLAPGTDRPADQQRARARELR